MNKRSLSDNDFFPNKKNKVNLHTYSEKKFFYDSDDESSNKKRKCELNCKSTLLIEDIKCNYCGKFLHQHSSQNKADCTWLPIYDELMSWTEKLSLDERIG